jgi:rhodanese-related sulfurtransferase
VFGVQVRGAAVALVAVTLFAGTAPASEGPYCGVYCAYAALKMHGSAVELAQLIDHRYVPTGQGSSLDDLCRAVRDFGGQAVPLQGLGEAALRASPDPVILHVRRPVYRSEFAHWVLYLGSDGSTAHILDPPGKAQDVPFAELLAVSDGVGIAVVGGPQSVRVLQVGGWLAQTAALALLAAAVGCLRQIAPRLAARRGAGVVLIPAVAVGAALVEHAGFAGGFLCSPGAVGEVTRRYFEPDLPAVSAEEVAERIGRPGVTIVDCRLEPAYQMAHISGAINLPISANTAERVHTLAGVPTDSQLIVYCQSEGCEWSRQMAGDLYHRGYRHIALFRDGWVGWERYEHDHRATGR